MPKSLSFYLRAPYPFLQGGLKAFSPLLFPKIPGVRAHDVFKATTKGTEGVCLDTPNPEPKSMSLRRSSIPL
jgi:hypothetical protein